MSNGSLDFDLSSVMHMLSISQNLFSEWGMFSSEVTPTLNRLDVEGLLVTQYSLVGKDDSLIYSKGADMM